MPQLLPPLSGHRPDQVEAEVQGYTAECLVTHCTFMPPHIIQSSLESLVDDDGLRKVLAARFMTRKATWWMRVLQQDFVRMHQREVTDTC